jgi:hypothetical protein
MCVRGSAHSDCVMKVTARNQDALHAGALRNPFWPHDLKLNFWLHGEVSKDLR